MFLYLSVILFMVGGVRGKGVCMMGDMSGEEGHAW